MAAHEDRARVDGLRAAKAGQAASPLMIESEDQRFVEGFRVVVERTVGEVRFGGGETSPYQAAFAIIAESGEDGTFRFPGEGAGEVTVVVTHG